MEIWSQTFNSFIVGIIFKCVFDSDSDEKITSQLCFLLQTLASFVLFKSKIWKIITINTFNLSTAVKASL